MSQLKSKVGPWSLKWKSVPRGREGTAQLEARPGVVLEVRWKKDGDGLWLQLPHGIFGFDFQGERDENGQILFRVDQRLIRGEWTQVAPSLGEGQALAVSQGGKAKATRVRSQMPGKIIRVMVQVDQMVQKDQPILVMEAMKMENEIRAPQAGKVTQVKVTEGQAVETGADLILLDPAG
jgi:biotin carboxyl carrier protein